MAEAKQQVERGFIPEGEKPLAHEKVMRFSRGKGGFNAVNSGFTPGPDQVIIPRAKNWAEREARRRRNQQIAEEASIRHAYREDLNAYEDAKRRLRDMNVPEAVAQIESMPERTQEIWLLAEEDGQNRKTLYEYVRRQPDKGFRAQLFSIEEES